MLAAGLFHAESTKEPKSANDVQMDQLYIIFNRLLQ